MWTSRPMKGAALVAVTAAAVAIAGSAPAISATRASTHLEVNVTEGPFTRFVDIGETGFSPGDLVMEDQPVSDPASGDGVGRAIGTIQIVRLFKSGDGVTILDTTLRLGEGSISIHGPARLSELDGTSSVRFAVIGGTGIYGSAIGEAVIDHQEGSDIYAVSIELTTA